MLTYDDCHTLATAHPNHGAAVEGNEIHLWSLAYRAEALAEETKAHRWMVATYPYNPVSMWINWLSVANRMERAYSANSGDPMLPGFKPNTRHTIGEDGRKMAAYYMERYHRRAVLAGAGVPMTAELEAGLPEVED